MKKGRIYQLFILFLIVILSTSGFSCLSSKPKVKLEPITLTYWRVWESPDVLNQIIADYHRLHPNITINCRKLRYEEYEQTLLEAWAEGRGPDIFSIPADWVTKYSKFIYPLPPKIKMVNIKYSGNALKKTAKIVAEEKRTITPDELRQKFVDVVFNDVVRYDPQSKMNRIYALPLAIDTLALYYNRDMLDNAGIAKPPTNWEEFKEDVKKLIIQDTEGNFIQSGAALGTADNIERSADILSLLMLQNGTKMIKNWRASFNQPLETDKSYFPGVEALRFYTDFANPAKEVYTWNSEMPNSLDAFIDGKVAFFFGYSYHLPIIQARAPKLDFGVVPVPQIEGSLKQVNYARYWVETVSSHSQNKDAAWDFLQFATTSAKEVKTYLDAAKKPPALRELIDVQLENFDLAPFTQQVLTAQDWYYGKDPLAVEEIFKEMIRMVNQGLLDYKKAINYAVERVNQTY